MENLLSDDLSDKYDFIVICNNILVSILKQAGKKQWESEEFNIKKEDIDKFENCDLEYWRKNGYGESLNKCTYKMFFFSILSDYLNYTFEANNNASKYKINVAYSLLRKPLKDNLYFLERLENEKIGFIEKFLDSPIEEFDTSAISLEEKKYLLQKVISDTEIGIDSDFLYDLRYSRKEEFGLERIWNQTQHIITTCKHYKTKDGNLNMIFNDLEDISEFVNYFYLLMPVIQYYVVMITFKFLEDMDLINELEKTINYYLITIKYLKIMNKNSKNKMNSDIMKILKDLFIICPKCAKTINKDTHISFYHNILSSWSITCPHCNKNIKLDRFIFYNYKKIDKLLKDINKD